MSRWGPVFDASIGRWLPPPPPQLSDITTNKKPAPSLGPSRCLYHQSGCQRPCVGVPGGGGVGVRWGSSACSAASAASSAAWERELSPSRVFHPAACPAPSACSLVLGYDPIATWGCATATLASWSAMKDSPSAEYRAALTYARPVKRSRCAPIIAWNRRGMPGAMYTPPRLTRGTHSPSVNSTSAGAGSVAMRSRASLSSMPRAA
mmetsp:Transcript_32899/g.83503  ORF Transcript_32899/g.83503 Transcript_32899/m.83503 type:complete len:206 (+) Transcript_32899:1601-2218(+)